MVYAWRRRTRPVGVRHRACSSGPLPSHRLMAAGIHRRRGHHGDHGHGHDCADLWQERCRFSRMWTGDIRNSAESVADRVGDRTRRCAVHLWGNGVRSEAMRGDVKGGA